MEQKLLAGKKRRHSVEVEHSRGQETLEKEKKKERGKWKLRKKKGSKWKGERECLEAAKREVAKRKQRELAEAKRE